MTTRIAYERLLEVVDGDQELIALLLEEGVLVATEEGFSAQDVDLVLCSLTLVRELDVNLAGVDIILRLRAELARARRKLAELDPQRQRDSSET
jgi:hypothetical protein